MVVQVSANLGLLQRKYIPSQESASSSMAVAMTTEKKYEPRRHYFKHSGHGHTAQQPEAIHAGNHSTHSSLVRRIADLLVVPVVLHSK